MIANCGHDENNKYSGGKAGDQTGGEWAVIPWYSRPWNCVLRHPDENVRKLIAQMAVAAANNNNIGYDQGQRGTFWAELKKAKYKPEKIKVKCEADCSSGTAAIVKAVGYLLNIQKLKDVSTSLYTGNMRNFLKQAGFEILTDNKYLSSDKYLLAGDILLNDAHHVAINVSLHGTGVKAKKNKKSINTIAKEVIAGKWGNGPERKKKIEKAGYDYSKVQKEVNKILKK